jgi:hypothetical protein
VVRKFGSGFVFHRKDSVGHLDNLC